MSIEEIFAALLIAHPSDKPAIKKFVAWIKFRRRMYNEFFMDSHWVQSENRYHWIGSEE